ncbi:TetR/AcrR family transcriptional regulator [Sphingomonas sp. BK235]|jgi:AcrR family transcriptional regulator|uniref:TetR/AcrR family transcriptional regulator n=1 Tax=Sphingomonas sp. BK235 TaxID=2512131 RepID=UPI0010D2A945|nr:TetR/AcrR family transcriptional regulator [Sphingomonas sp. BK235]TCP31056.1 TetR family transcriptional regulator [Sphingomonas sp. BK235]
MSSDPPRTTRRPRIDGERNRAALLAAAHQALVGEGADVSLERIARAAKVGIGTLYRHFPTRNALIEAVYRQEIDTLVAAAFEIAKTGAPREGLRAWLRMFVDFLETKREIAGVLDTLIGGSEPLYSKTPTLLSPAIDILVRRLEVAEGTSVPISPLDLLRGIVGVATVRQGQNWKEQTYAFVDVMLSGLFVHQPAEREPRGEV